ncbi:MAG: RNA methyltransferase [Raineya sp.]|jgi:TrmH family RNA methyltransferase|nr:RNA methyltransferase [Raineya sp.]
MSYEIITSLQNPKIKNILRLEEKASERKSQNLIVIEGTKELELAIKGNVDFQTLFFCKDLISERDFEKTFQKYLSKTQVFEVSKQVFEKIAYRENIFGVVALAKPRFLTLDKLQLSASPLILVLENVEKPGNLGAILRTADAASVDAVLVCNPQTDIFNPNAIRSGLGCVFTKQVVACTNEQALEFLKKNNIQMLATALTASKPYTQIDYTKPTAIIMGTEATGLTDFWIKNASQNIIIPMRGEIDSMNVSVTTAIVTFEAIRQRDSHE